mmetsp:Transcript_4470/g.10075  ORF Transcript_4470/g.10075 Transcript_4470/m.10075 type:complete len:99 (+) Transcript_4470:63-359(+)
MGNAEGFCSCTYQPNLFSTAVSNCSFHTSSSIAQNDLLASSSMSGKRKDTSYTMHYDSFFLSLKESQSHAHCQNLQTNLKTTSPVLHHDHEPYESGKK